MQTLWSRAAQTRTCQCGASLSNGLARRTTTAAGRRRLKPGDAFTAFYSAIFATAALADAKIKDDRRREWDDAIGAVKNELEQSKHAQPAQRASTRGQRRDAMPSPTPVISEIPWEQAVRGSAARVLPRHEPHLVTLAQIRQVQASQWQAGVLTNDFYVDDDKPFTLWQVWRRQKSVAKLVRAIMDDLVKEVEARDGPLMEKRPTGALSTSSAEMTLTFADMHRRLRSMVALSRDTSEYPKYMQGTSPTSTELEETNDAIFSHFAQHRRDGGRFEIIMAHVCYSLLISSTPPNAETYNILMVQLSRLKRHSLMQHVVRSFVESRVKPNAYSISVMLKYFTDIRDEWAFRHLEWLMSGFGGGMGSAMRRFDLVLKRDPRLADRDNHRYLTGMLVRKAPRNVVTYGALIQAALVFSGVSQATRYLQQMARDGLQANVKILTCILKACVQKRDWATGAAIWRQIKALPGEDDAPDGRAYFWMLRLCEECFQPGVFHEVYREAARRFPVGAKGDVAPPSQYLPSIKHWGRDERLILGDWRRPAREDKGGGLPGIRSRHSARGTARKAEEASDGAHLHAYNMRPAVTAQAGA